MWHRRRHSAKQSHECPSELIANDDAAASRPAVEFCLGDAASGAVQLAVNWPSNGHQLTKRRGLAGGLRCPLLYTKELTRWVCSSTGPARPSGPGPSAAPGLVLSIEPELPFAPPRSALQRSAASPAFSLLARPTREIAPSRVQAWEVTPTVTMVTVPLAKHAVMPPAPSACGACSRARRRRFISRAGSMRKNMTAGGAWPISAAAHLAHAERDRGGLPETSDRQGWLWGLVPSRTSGSRASKASLATSWGSRSMGLSTASAAVSPTAELNTSASSAIRR